MNNDENDAVIEAVAMMIRDMKAEHNAAINSLREDIGRLEAMLIPPPPLGLAIDPNTLQYMCLTFFDNGLKPAQGQSRFVLKIEANKEAKNPTYAKDFACFANLYNYEKFRPTLTPKRGVDEEQKTKLLNTIANFSGSSNHMFGLISVKGGKTGTMIFPDQLAILATDGKSAPMPAVARIIIGGGHGDYVTNTEWKDRELKTGAEFKAKNIKAKCFCYPRDEKARADEKKANGGQA